MTRSGSTRLSKYQIPNEFQDEYTLIRQRINEELLEAGFIVTDGSISLPPGDAKTIYRKLHMVQRQERIESSLGLIDKWEDAFISKIATPDEIRINEIEPRLRLVVTPEDRGLFNYAALTWSVPVSKGFGRRLYFLVEDKQNDKLIGIFALGDPVYNLSVRDNLIGWTQEEKKLRLYNVFDAFVCGALDPYRKILAGKLVAMLTTSNEISSMITNKYQANVTQISGTNKDSRPALITVTSALGRSSIYNRLRINERYLLKSQGYTKGFGHFHFSLSLYAELLEIAKRHPKYTGAKYGDGANWKIRTLRQALTLIGADNSLMQHGLNREVFLGELAPTTFEFLRGETNQLEYFQSSVHQISSYWRNRWALPRNQSENSMSGFDADNLRLSRELSLIRK